MVGDEFKRSPILEISLAPRPQPALFAALTALNSNSTQPPRAQPTCNFAGQLVDRAQHELVLGVGGVGGVGAVVGRIGGGGGGEGGGGIL